MIQVYEGDGVEPSEPADRALRWGILRRDRKGMVSNQYLGEYKEGEAMPWRLYDSESCDALCMAYTRSAADAIVSSLQHNDSVSSLGVKRWTYWVRRVR